MNRTFALLLMLVTLASGCAKKDAAPKSTETPPASSDHAETPRFAGKTWRVSASSAVASGTTYEFRSDGKLVVSSPGSTPLTGSWSWKEGALTMTEEGIDYPTDILALDDSVFSIRSHNPGQPVDITMVRALP